MLSPDPRPISVLNEMSVAISGERFPDQATVAFGSVKTGQDGFELRQDDLAQLLGVQRTTINGVWRTFIEDDAVRGTRGRIRIVDRTVLQRFTCECYATFAAEPGWNGPRPTGSLSI